MIERLRLQGILIDLRTTGFASRFLCAREHALGQQIFLMIEVVLGCAFRQFDRLASFCQLTVLEFGANDLATHVGLVGALDRLGMK